MKSRSAAEIRAIIAATAEACPPIQLHNGASSGEDIICPVLSTECEDDQIETDGFSSRLTGNHTQPIRAASISDEAMIDKTWSKSVENRHRSNGSQDHEVYRGLSPTGSYLPTSALV